MRLRENPYEGVNPHLMALLLRHDDPSPSAFPSFHAEHINHITNTLNEQLPDRYVARSEQSLQIRTEDFLTGEYVVKNPKPDSTIYEQSGAAGLGTASATVTTPTWQRSVDSLALARMTPSVMIREVEPHSLHGNPVTRLELLSPSNKVRGSAYGEYMANRLVALQSGTALLELDYLHESPSPAVMLLNLPVYPHDENAYPYTVSISRPAAGEIDIQVFGISIDHPLPTVNIPLLDGEALSFDFDAVYQRTFLIGRWGNYIDYKNPMPDHILASFRHNDQGTIKDRIYQILTEEQG